MDQGSASAWLKAGQAQSNLFVDMGGLRTRKYMLYRETHLSVPESGQHLSLASSSPTHLPTSSCSRSKKKTFIRVPKELVSNYTPLSS